MHDAPIGHGLNWRKKFLEQAASWDHRRRMLPAVEDYLTAWYYVVCLMDGTSRVVSSFKMLEPTTPLNEPTNAKIGAYGTGDPSPDGPGDDIS